MNLSVLDTVLNYAERVIKIAREHPFLAKTLGLAILIFTIIWFIHDEFAYNRPARVIENFYDNINSQNYEGAFLLLSRKYADKRFNNKLSSFTEGYSTTKRHTDLSIKFIDERSKGLLRDFTSSDKEYFITFEAEDIFKYEDLSNNINTNNSDILWLQTFKVKRITNILNPSVINYSLKRYFKKNVKLYKEHGEWRIDDMKSLEIGIRY